MRKIIFVLILLVLVNGCDNQQIEKCKVNSDCVAAECCHPTNCVSKDKVPDCKGIMCTMECKPGTLDCGQGSCKCLNEKCEAVIK